MVLVKILSAHVDVKEAADVLPLPQEQTLRADAAEFRAQIQMSAVQVFKVQILAADVQVRREATLAVQEYRARIPAATAPTAVTKIAAAEDAAAGHKPNKAPGNPGLLNIKQIQKAIL